MFYYQLSLPLSYFLSLPHRQSLTRRPPLPPTQKYRWLRVLRHQRQCGDSPQPPTSYLILVSFSGPKWTRKQMLNTPLFHLIKRSRHPPTPLFVIIFKIYNRFFVHIRRDFKLIQSRGQSDKFPVRFPQPVYIAEIGRASCREIE